MIRTYKLKFDNEAQSIASVSAATTGIPSYYYSIKVIGIHKEYEYDETDPEAEPTVIEHEGWHVDIVSGEPLEFPVEYLIYPKSPIHNFAGVPDDSPVPVTYVPSQKTMTARIGNAYSFTLTPDQSQIEIPEVYLSYGDDTIIQCSLKDSGSDVIGVDLNGISAGSATLVVRDTATEEELGRLKVTVKE